MPKQNEPQYEPTPEEIAAGTAKIRAGWKDGREPGRRGPKEKRNKDYVPKVCRFYGRRNGSVGIEIVDGLSMEVE